MGLRALDVSRATYDYLLIVALSPETDVANAPSPQSAVLHQLGVIFHCISSASVHVSLFVFLETPVQLEALRAQAREVVVSLHATDGGWCVGGDEDPSATHAHETLYGCL